MARKLAVLTSGGDAPGMNAAIRSVVRTAINRDWNVVGVRRGYAGLIEEDFIPLFRRSVGGIIHRGGTMLRTARCPEFQEEEYQLQALDFLYRINTDMLVVIGGDGSMAGAKALSEHGFATVAIPGTIDNDMIGTDETIGFDTAVNTAVEAVNVIRDTAFSHERIAVVEVMGRNSGHIALRTAAACGAEAVLIPEVPVDINGLIQKLESCRYSGKKHGIIIVAEGAMKGYDLVKILQESTEYEPSITVLGYIQRGGAPTAHDSLLGSKMGEMAVEALATGMDGALIAMDGCTIRPIPYDELSAEKREPEWNLLRLVDELST